MQLTARQEFALTLGCWGIIALALAGGMWIAAAPLHGPPGLTLRGSEHPRACESPTACGRPGGGFALAESSR